VSLQTDPGCQRELNEDQIFFHRPDDPALLKKKGLLVVVADGMGGHSAGEVASGMAVEIVDRAYFDNANNPGPALKSALQQANSEIHKASLGQDGLRGMGTTCTALVLQKRLGHRGPRRRQPPLSGAWRADLSDDETIRRLWKWSSAG